MKPAILLMGCLLLAAFPAAQVALLRPEPFVPIGVTYPSELSRDRERAAADFDAIRTLGFNSIRVPVGWATTESVRGEYQFDALDRTLELAAQVDLKVSIHLDTASLPSWLLRRYPDGRFVPESKADRSPSDRACLDHPGVRADTVAYVAAASERAARQSAWQAIDFDSDLPQGFCMCPHTERRFREWLKATFGSDVRPAASAAADRAAFVALERRDHLALLTGAAAARGTRPASSSAGAPSVIRRLFNEPPGQDDWMMATAVDQYGARVPPDLVRAAPLTPAQLALALDGMRSATREKGWQMVRRTVASRAPDVSSAADLRLATWMALSRGARGVVYTDWRAPAPGVSGGLVEPDGTITDRARIASALARVVGRNPALFAPLRPRAARVAIVYDPRPSGAQTAAIDALSNIYRALFERNIQVDFIHLDELATGMASRYTLVFAGAVSSLPAPAADALKAYAAAGGTLVSASRPPLGDPQVVQAATRAGVHPDVRIEGATGPVETRFLESPDVLMFVGLNHAATRQRVTMTFAPDTQEAIWQNMETGAAVNFVAGPNGPSYTYSFGPRDALVLMIRKGIR